MSALTFHGRVQCSCCTMFLLCWHASCHTVALGQLERSTGYILGYITRALSTLSPTHIQPKVPTPKFASCVIAENLKIERVAQHQSNRCNRCCTDITIDTHHKRMYGVAYASTACNMPNHDNIMHAATTLYERVASLKQTVEKM